MEPFAVPETDPPADRCFAAPTLTGLIREVARFVDECIRHGNCYFVIEASAKHRYVQGLIRARSGMTLESVSNASLANCCEQHCLTAEQEHALIRLAWRPPDESSPNWYRALDFIATSDALIAELLVRTLVEVHQTDADTRLHATTGEALGPARRIPVVQSRRAS